MVRENARCLVSSRNGQSDTAIGSERRLAGIGDPESYDDFTNLVLTILDYAVHEPKGLIRPVNIEEQYGKDGKLEKTIMRYTATKKVGVAKVDVRRKQPEYEYIRPEAMPQPKSFNDPLFLEQKRQLLRGTIFPIE